MSEPIDHYAKAQEMAVRAEDHLFHVFGKTEEAKAFTRLGQLHLDLHAAQSQPDTDDPYWALAGDLEALTTAVQELIVGAPAFTFATTEGADRFAAWLDRVRDLVDES